MSLKSKFELLEFLRIEEKNNFGTYHFETQINESYPDFDIEITFALNHFYKDYSQKKSYVNNYYTRMHDTLVDGVIKGIKKSFLNYLEVNPSN